MLEETVAKTVGTAFHRRPRLAMERQPSEPLSLCVKYLFLRRLTHEFKEGYPCSDERGGGEPDEHCLERGEVVRGEEITPGNGYAVHEVTVTRDCEKSGGKYDVERDPPFEKTETSSGCLRVGVECLDSG